MSVELHDGLVSSFIASSHISWSVNSSSNIRVKVPSCCTSWFLLYAKEKVFIIAFLLADHSSLTLTHHLWGNLESRAPLLLLALVAIFLHSTRLIIIGS